MQTLLFQSLTKHDNSIKLKINMQIFFTKIHRTAKITFWCTLNLKVSQQTGKKDQIVKFKQKTSLIYSTKKSECTLLKKKSS